MGVTHKSVIIKHIQRKNEICFAVFVLYGSLDVGLKQCY